jgi:hypothetical protein
MKIQLKTYLAPPLIVIGFHFSNMRCDGQIKQLAKAVCHKIEPNFWLFSCSYVYASFIIIIIIIIIICQYHELNATHPNMYATLFN